MFWKRFDSSQLKGKGLLIEGDPTTRRTKRWPHLFLVLKSWKKIHLVKVHTGLPCYRLICLRSDGVCKVYYKPIYSKIIRVGVRHEDCRFYAIDGEGREITVTSLEQNLDRNSKAYGDLMIV